MPPPFQNDADPFEGLRNRVRGALLAPNRQLEALELLKELLAVDPQDQDARRNLDGLLKQVNRKIEAVEGRLNLQCIEGDPRLTELQKELDQRVPHWRGFADEIPRLKPLAHIRSTEDEVRTEEQLLQLLHAGHCDEAVSLWLKQGASLGMDGGLSVILSAIARVCEAENSGDHQPWREALDELRQVIGGGASAMNIEATQNWESASRWRLGVSTLVSRINAVNSKTSRVEVRLTADQLNLAGEELRAKPSLSGGRPVVELLTQASASLRRFDVAPSQNNWIVPLIFALLVATAAGTYYFNLIGNSGSVGSNGSQPETIWPPKPSSRAFNPAPSADDVTIPMPGAWEMTFRKIHLPKDSEKPGILELESDGVEGHVWAPFGDETGRYFLIGKYEVTVGQFAQFMNLAEEGPVENPVTNITVDEMEKFCLLFSTWLGQQRSFTLQSVSGRPARTRLPTLLEWEYAARGGVVTFGSELFKKPWPWEGSVTPREWHSGPASSNGKLHPIGKLKMHSLGMHDMLGNAREMATGGLSGATHPHWMVGADFTTSEGELSAALRVRVPQLMPHQNQVFKQEEQGFRLLISSDADGFQVPTSAVPTSAIR